MGPRIPGENFPRRMVRPSVGPFAEGCEIPCKVGAQNKRFLSPKKKFLGKPLSPPTLKGNFKPLKEEASLKNGGGKIKIRASFAR